MGHIGEMSFFKALRGWQMCAVYFVVIATVYTVAFYFAGDSQFVRTCPSQYAAHVLSLLITASSVTVLGYVVSAFLVGAALADSSPPTTQQVYLICEIVVLVIAAAFAGITGMFTWGVRGGVGRLDAVDLFPIIFAILAVIASFLEKKATNSAYPKEGKAIDIPLLVGLVLVLIAKYVVFGRTYSNWDQWIINRSYFPQGYTHNWDIKMGDLVADMRSVFWLGLSMGVVAVQMMVAVLGRALIRMGRQ